MNRLLSTQFLSTLDLVWTAPEHLRDKLPGSRSQKGDVYSYAIILHEITLQSGPFGNTDLTSEGKGHVRIHSAAKYRCGVFVYKV